MGPVSDAVPAPPLPPARRVAGDYAGCSALAGLVTEPGPGPVRITYRPLIDAPRDRWTLNAYFLVAVAFDVAFIAVVVSHLTGASAAGVLALAAIVAGDVVRVVNLLGLWIFARVAGDPVTLTPQAGTRVALLTTIVPSCEPVEMVAVTLAAMRRVRHDGLVDVWILDEGDDPAVREVATRLGVMHFSRHGRPERNTAAGAFRARTKAGNHNAWRVAHGARYDVVAQLDPDHVPEPDFLERTLGYFRDPDVAFVVAPQVYGNHDGFVPHAAAQQSYVFAGLVQRGGNGLGAPLLIGTNHVYRMAAWDRIGGYQDSIIEDHLTSLVVHTSVNPATGRCWTGVYTPDVLAIGQAPATWGDFLRQQRRWAFGVWQIVLTASPRLMRLLTARQRLAYLFLQMFYPTVGLSWVVTNLATVGYLLGVPSVTGLGPLGWLPPAGAFLSSVALFRWLRRFYLCDRERRDGVLPGFLVTVLAAPVYAGAGVSALMRHSLEFDVTAKGRLIDSGPARSTVFRPLLAGAWLLAAALLVGLGAGTAAPASVSWALVGLATCLAPWAWPVVIRGCRTRRPARSRCARRRTRPRRSPAGSPERCPDRPVAAAAGATRFRGSGSERPR